MPITNGFPAPESEDGIDDEIDEIAWLQSVASNPVFDFLNDPAEDIYSPTDGKPFKEQG